MSTPTYGQAATIENAPFPPTAVNIVSSTNASPTVITATAHGLHTGQVVAISGHLVNTNVDGIWLAAVVTADTFRITNFSGTLINGNGVGVATGSVQSLAFPGASLPEDTADDRDAASVNVPFEFCLDALADLAYRSLMRVPGVFEVTDAPDADASLDCTYLEYRIPDTLAAGRTYTLISTAGGRIPKDGARMKFSRTGALLTNTVTFNREGAVTIATIAATTAAGVEFVFRTSDSKWHVSSWSGNTTPLGIV